ncbi:hypothetical protein Rhal01_01169 [Rubritalea halochordaticola]|uniref:Ice-binding protein C-terminal domain-containing protein n=1 Tax=Rubritalea halochordaticola TaxID=714537 RepID=A0ABP9UX72_9BACT
MKKLLIMTVGALALSTSFTSAALLLTFTEEGDDVVMQASGSVDVSGARFIEDQRIGVVGDFFGVFTSDVYSMPNGDWVGDTVEGVAYLWGGGGALTAWIWGTSDSGSGDFFLDGNDGAGVASLTMFSSSDPNIVVDGSVNTMTFVSTRRLTFSGQSFDSMELNVHELDMVHDLWGAHEDATNDEKIQFVVSSTTVPEPSSTILFGLGSLALLLRKRRQLGIGGKP